MIVVAYYLQVHISPAVFLTMSLYYGIWEYFFELHLVTIFETSKVQEKDEAAYQEAMQIAQKHVADDKADLAMTTLAKAYHGVQMSSMDTPKRQELKLALRNEMIEVAVRMHKHNEQKILDCILHYMKMASVIDDDNEVIVMVVISQLLNAYHHIFKNSPQKFHSRSKASRQRFKRGRRSSKKKKAQKALDDSRERAGDLTSDLLWDGWI